MIGYFVGIVFIILPLADYLYRRHKIKNRIEVDARVIKTSKWHGGESGDVYYPVFQYSIDGQRYETKQSVGLPKYPIDTVIRIYAYKNNPKKIVLPDQIKISVGADIFFMLMGIMVVCYQIFWECSQYSYYVI